MASKYSFSTSRMNDFILRGKAKSARTSTVAVDYDKGSLRNTEPEQTKTVEKSFKWKADTYMGETSMVLSGAMVTRCYAAGNPDGGGKDSLTYDVKEARVYATSLVLPAGYSMTASASPSRVQERKSGNATYPVFDIKVVIEVGPMVGTWTKYDVWIVFDAMKGTIKF